MVCATYASGRIAGGGGSGGLPTPAKIACRPPRSLTTAFSCSGPYPRTPKAFPGLLRPPRALFRPPQKIARLPLHSRGGCGSLAANTRRTPQRARAPLGKNLPGSCEEVPKPLRGFLYSILYSFTLILLFLYIYPTLPNNNINW